MIPITSHRDHRAEELAEARGSTTISVAIAARDEEATIAAIVETIATELVEGVGLVDELVVLDDHSVDATATRAAAAGATVVSAADVLPDHPGGPGKGQAMWRSLAVTRGDIIVWIDGDLHSFGSHFVTGLIGPLVRDPGVDFVKGTYERPLVDGVGGGRVTELMARPLLSLLGPELASLGQPLGGEYAGRRRLLETLPFARGYGVEIGLLLEIATRHGTAGIAQVDLGMRHHRNRTLQQLGPQALEILHVALAHLDPHLVGESASLVRPGGIERAVTTGSLPPIVSLTEHCLPTR